MGKAGDLEEMRRIDDMIEGLKETEPKQLSLALVLSDILVERSIELVYRKISDPYFRCFVAIATF